MMRNSKGFTMIELIIALLILILGVTAALRLFPTGLKSGRAAAIITNTGFVACAAFEGYAKRLPFDDLSRRSSPFQPFFKKPSAGSFGGGELTPEWIVADYKPGAESFIRGGTFPICIPNVSKVTISVPIPEIVAEHGWVQSRVGTWMRAMDENGQPFSWEDGQFNGMMLVMVVGRGR